MDDVDSTLLSQYANSPTITAIIEYFNQWIDPSADLDAFYADIWDIESANDVGLNIWGKIVNVPRTLTIKTDETYFGYGEANGSGIIASGIDVSGYAQPFNQAPFYNGTDVTTTYTLATEAYRKLIMVKAMANITNCTVPSLNALLQYLFAGEGRCYVQDTGEMMLRYVFEFTLSAVEMAIMVNSGVVPRPAGVKASIYEIDPTGTFGFNGSGLEPFGYGTLSTGVIDAE